MNDNNAPVIFEEIKRKNENNAEFWSARELGNILGYSQYRHFLPVIEKAKEACINSKQPIKEHFEDYLQMIKLGHDAERPISDIKLSRYAGYLVMQNADPSKEIVALGQTYFAIQTRRQEIQDQMIEDAKRLDLREEITAHNKHLFEAASMAGVKNYGRFTNYGYMGLYGGKTKDDIQKKKGLTKNKKILDFMNSEAMSNQTHFKVGQKIRETIKELGGTMPENLAVPDAITQAKKRLKTRSEKFKIK